GGSSSGGSSSGGSSSDGSSSGSSNSSSTTSDSVENGTWTSTILESGQVIWSFGGDNGPIIDRWAYVQNPYKTGNQPESGWFYFDATGTMQTGWFTDTDGHIYYLLPDSNGSQGIMLTGWQLIEGKYYYFSTISGTPLGSMLMNTITPDGYYVNEDGSWNE
ncbi:MAG: hypothetical protein ACI39W_06860, partial [Brotaphodocola sp.]